jgi:hypothetical protein
MEALSADELQAVAQALPALGRVLSQAEDGVGAPPEGPLA